MVVPIILPWIMLVVHGILSTRKLLKLRIKLPLSLLICGLSLSPVVMLGSDESEVSFVESEVSLIAVAIVLFVSVYPIYLVWRFLTLGIKAFKKYLSEQPYYTDYREDEE